MEKIMIMSIKTKYVNQIMSGVKTFEFRRKPINNLFLNQKIYLYSAGEEKSIVGYIVVDKILKGDINYILKETNTYNDDIKKYFVGAINCYALHISSYHLFKNYISLNELKKTKNNIRMPQYYQYIKKYDKIYDLITNKN